MHLFACSTLLCCTFLRVVHFLCFTFFVLLHAVLVSCCTFSMLQFFYVALFQCCNFFVWHTFSVVLFPCYSFSILYTVHVAPFSVLHSFHIVPYFVMHCSNYLCLVFFRVVSCRTLSVLHYPNFAVLLSCTIFMFYFSFILQPFHPELFRGALMSHLPSCSTVFKFNLF